jgi:hypothetical protein
VELIGRNKPDKACLLTFDQLDGRTMAAKNARALIDNIESDLGGADRLTAAEREIVQRAALASALCQHMETLWLMGKGIDVASYATLVNTQRRLLATMGLARRPRDVTPELSAYIAQRAGQGDEQEAPADE